MSWLHQKSGIGPRHGRIGVQGIAERFGVELDEAKDWTQRFTFPRPVHPRAWVLAEVERWAARNGGLARGDGS